MTYKALLSKYIGRKAHFDLGLEGFYLIDFSGASYSNAILREAQDEYVIVFDEVEKHYLVLPYAQIVIRFGSEQEGELE